MCEQLGDQPRSCLYAYVLAACCTHRNRTQRVTLPKASNSILAEGSEARLATPPACSQAVAVVLMLPPGRYNDAAWTADRSAPCPHACPTGTTSSQPGATSVEACDCEFSRAGLALPAWTFAGRARGWWSYRQTKSSQKAALGNLMQSCRRSCGSLLINVPVD